MLVEGGKGFLGRRRLKHGAEMPVFLGDLFGYRVEVARFEQLLGDAQRCGRQGGKFGGLVIGVRHQIRGGQHFVDEPHVERLKNAFGKFTSSVMHFQVENKPRRYFL